MVRTGARLGRGLVSDEAAAGGLLWLGHSDIESTVRDLKRLPSVHIAIGAGCDLNQ